MISLSIVIPTFNRAGSLDRILELLLPQINDRIDVTVIDNASPDNTASIIQKWKRSYPSGTLTYVRNRINVGGPANVLRCFEHGSHDWICIVGDDDTPRPDFVTKVLTDISRFSDTVFINFASTLLDRGSGTRTASTRACGVAEFIKQMDSFSNALFISAGAYRREAIAPHVRQAYFACDTFGPHIAVLIHTLNAHPEYEVVFSDSFTIDWAPAPPEQAWHCKTIDLGLCKLAKLVPTCHQQAFLTKIRKVHGSADYAPTLRHITQVLGRSPNAAPIMARYYAELASVSPQFAGSAILWIRCAAAIGTWKESLARMISTAYVMLKRRTSPMHASSSGAIKSIDLGSDASAPHPRQ